MMEGTPSCCERGREKEGRDGEGRRGERMDK